MVGRLAATLWDWVFEQLFHHYSTSSDIARRHLALGDDGLVLDVGGGTGGIAARLARDVGRVVVIDPHAARMRRGHLVYRGPAFEQVRGAGRGSREAERAHPNANAADCGDPPRPVATDAAFALEPGRSEAEWVRPEGLRPAAPLLFVRARGEALPFPDACADAALLVEVLHHVSDDRGVLAEIARVLRPGGRLLIEESEFDGRYRYRYWIEKLAYGGLWPRTRDGLRARLESLGFAVRPLEEEGFVILATRR